MAMEHDPFIDDPIKNGWISPVRKLYPLHELGATLVLAMPGCPRGARLGPALGGPKAKQLVILAVFHWQYPRNYGVLMANENSCFTYEKT